MDFEIYFLIFFKLGDFKIFFEILKISNIPIVRKVILYGEIIVQLKETVYIRIDYIGLSKGRSFIMIEIYSITSNIILDSTIPKIAILINPTKKAFKFDKNTYIATIYKYADTIYLIIGSLGVFATLIIASATIFKLLSPV